MVLFFFFFSNHGTKAIKSIDQAKALKTNTIKFIYMVSYGIICKNQIKIWITVSEDIESVAPVQIKHFLDLKQFTMHLKTSIVICLKSK